MHLLYVHASSSKYLETAAKLPVSPTQMQKWGLLFFSFLFFYIEQNKNRNSQWHSG